MHHNPYHNPELARSDFEPSSLAVHEALQMLNSPALAQEITAGNVTLAMIRPAVGPDANLLGLPDAEAAEQIENMITGMGVAAKFSFNFTPEAVEQFYGGAPRESMSGNTPKDPSRYDNRWPEFVDFMTSGPTTVLLLHSPDGQAIQRWRDHLGHWNIDEHRDPSTIRGQLGVDSHNNLVHGSDTPESVLRELGIIKGCLEAKLYEGSD